MTAADRMLWAWLSRAWSGWRPALVLVKPETVLAWHRRGFRVFWTWKSRYRTGHHGEHRRRSSLIVPDGFQIRSPLVCRACRFSGENSRAEFQNVRKQTSNNSPSGEWMTLFERRAPSARSFCDDAQDKQIARSPEEKGQNRVRDQRRSQSSSPPPPE